MMVGHLGSGIIKDVAEKEVIIGVSMTIRGMIVPKVVARTTAIIIGKLMIGSMRRKIATEAVNMTKGISKKAGSMT